MLGEKPQAMPAAESGWRRLTVPEARAGDRYRYRIDGGLMVPDPASRFQPDDITGPSRIVDARAFDWSDGAWTGRPWEEAVIYEVHVGTATPEGTYAGLAEKLEELRDLGVTAIELMPLADFPGRRNWGYDGVLPFAPDSSYGAPDDLKRLVDRAHGLGLMMFLDVVYNHFGPAGNYLHAYARSFFTERHQTPWGAGLNFDGPDARPVRDFFVHNALYWLEEYHFDGLRFDAVHAILDDSQEHIIAEIAERARAALPGREIHLVLENEENAGALARARAGRALAHPYGAMERRPPSLLARARHRRGRWLLRGLRRCTGRAAGACARRGLCLPGRLFAPQGRGPRRELDASAAFGLRRLSPEPRPDRQPRLRRAHHRTRGPGASRARPGRPPALAADSDALHGRGMGGLGAVPVLRRFLRRSRAVASGARRAATRVRELQGLRGAAWRGRYPRPDDRGDLQAVGARLVRGRALAARQGARRGAPAVAPATGRGRATDVQRILRRRARPSGTAHARRDLVFRRRDAALRRQFRRRFAPPSMPRPGRACCGPTPARRRARPCACGPGPAPS